MLIRRNGDNCLERLAVGMKLLLIGFTEPGKHVDIDRTLSIRFQLLSELLLCDTALEEVGFRLLDSIPRETEAITKVENVSTDVGAILR